MARRRGGNYASSPLVVALLIGHPQQGGNPLRLAWYRWCRV